MTAITLPKHPIMEEIGFDGREDFQILITPPVEVIDELFSKAKALMKEEGYIDDLAEREPTEECYGIKISGFCVDPSSFEVATLRVPAPEPGQIPGEVSYGDCHSYAIFEKIIALISESGILDNDYVKIKLDAVSEVGFFAGNGIGLNLQDPQFWLA